MLREPCYSLSDLLLADHMHSASNFHVAWAAQQRPLILPKVLFTAFLVPLPRLFLRLFRQHRPHLLQLRRSLRASLRETPS